MKKVEGISITTYEVSADFMVDIVDMEDFFEAWIYRNDMGVKDMMFGCPKISANGLVTTCVGFSYMVANSWEEYADSYDRNHY